MEWPGEGPTSGGKVASGSPCAHVGLLLEWGGICDQYAFC